MAYIQGAERGQGFLLPESIEDYVGPEHPVRAIDAFVEALDLGRLGFAKAVPAATGRPPYAPGDLLRLYLWGYFNRVSSSRRLETECARNLELLWLLRRLRPDFKTIADFRRDHPGALKEVFRQFVFVCRELGLYGRELVAIDGTKLKASNHPAARADAAKLQAWIAALDARIDGHLAEAEASDQAEAGAETAAAAAPPALAPGELARRVAALRRRKDRLNAALAAAMENGGGQVAIHDPDALGMAGVGLGYNAQLAVDDKHHLIAAAELADAATDSAQLPLVAAQAAAALRADHLAATADAGYHDQLALARAEAAGIECYVPRPRRGHAASLGIPDREAFGYDAARDAYRCPAGQWLGRSGRGYYRHGLFYQGYANAPACRQCPLRTACTKGPYRRIDRWENEATMAAIAARTAAHPEIVARRKALVEHPFGTIKHWWNQGAALTRGRERVGAELALSAWTYNFKRVVAILGVGGLRAGLARLRQEARATDGKAGGGLPRGVLRARSACRKLAALARRALAPARGLPGVLAHLHGCQLAA